MIGGNSVSSFTGSGSGKFVPDVLFFQHPVLVYTLVHYGGSQGSRSYGALAARMQPGAQRHRRKLDLGQQLESEADRPHQLGCSGCRDHGTIRMVPGSGQSSVLGGYPCAPEDISSKDTIFEVFY